MASRRSKARRRAPKAQPQKKAWPGGVLLKRARESAGFSNKSDFARRLEVTPNTVYRIEKGEFPPAVATLARWCSLCSVSADAVLGLPTSESAA